MLYLIYTDGYVHYATEDEYGKWMLHGNYSSPIGENLIRFIENDSADIPYALLADINSKEALGLRKYFKEELEGITFEGFNAGAEKAQPIEFLKFFNEVKQIYKIKFHIVRDDKKGFRIEQAYCVESLSEILSLEFVKLIGLGVSFKKCLNCGRFFIINKEYKTKYCDRVVPGKNKTCKEIGPILAYKKANTNNISKLYDKAYKTQHARRKRYKTISESDFANWLEWAIKAKDEAKKGGITEDQFRDLLDESLKAAKEDRFAAFLDEYKNKNGGESK